MADIANRVLSAKYVVATGNIVPCIGSSRGIDLQARGPALFGMPIQLTYYSGGKLVTVGANPNIKETTLKGQIDAMTVMVEYSIPQAPKPDQGSTATAVVRITTKDQNNANVDVTTNTTTVVQITMA